MNRNPLRAAVCVLLFLGTQAAYAAEIVGTDSIVVGNLLVLEGVAEGGNTRWIIPSVYADHALRTQTHIAMIPSRIGTITIIFVNARGRDISFTRHQVEVVENPRAEFTIHQPKRLAMPRRQSIGKADDDSRTLTMYSMPPEMGVCEPCIKWKSSEKAKLEGWLFVEDVIGDGITIFPSFEIRAGNHSMFLEGYVTSIELENMAEELEAIDE